MANISQLFGSNSAPSAGGVNNSGFTSAQLISSGATAVSDLFSGFGDITKMKGAEAEQQQYEIAAAYAGQEAQYQKMSTAINTAMANRELYLSQGRTRGELAGAGVAETGSGLDILRMSAQQGALASAVVNQQGQIQSQGYIEQQQAFESMANAAGATAKAENNASIGSFASAAISALPLLAAI